MKTTIKALDHYDALQAGHTYSVRSMAGARLVLFTDTISAKLVSLYKWQVEDGLLRGKLCWHDSAQSQAMSCSAAAVLCKKLDSGYCY